jgi:hypothetical protein
MFDKKKTSQYGRNIVGTEFILDTLVLKNLPVFDVEPRPRLTTIDLTFLDIKLLQNEKTFFAAAGLSDVIPRSILVGSSKTLHIKYKRFKDFSQI